MATSITKLIHAASPVTLIKEVGDLSLIIFCQMKELTPISKSLHFQCFKSIWSGQVFHSLIYNQSDCFAFFLSIHKAAILV